MANTTEFMENYSGGQLTAGDYNEVDAMIFAQLSYAQFDSTKITNPDILKCAGSEGLTVKEYADIIMSSDVYPKDDSTYKFLEQISNCDRYKDLKITNCVSTEQSTGTQFAAITVNVDSDTSVVAFRGTDGTPEAWDEDFYLAYSMGTEAQLKSADYLNNCDANHILVTGHSKGGNDGITGYVMADDATRARIERLDNFDGPGANQELRDAYSSEYSELGDKLHNHLPKGSVIGKLLGDHDGEVEYVDSDALEGFTQHDSHKWQVSEDGKSFVNKKQTELSKFLDRMLDNTLERLSPKEREVFVSLIVGSGLTNILAKIAGGELGWGETLLIALNKVREMSLDLSDEQNEIIRKLIAGLMFDVLAGFGIDGALLDGVCSILMDWAANNEDFQAIVELLRLSAVGVTSLIQMVIDIVNELNRLWQELCSFMSSIWNTIVNTIDGTNCDTYIEVNPGALTESASHYYKVSKTIYDYLDDLLAISLRMKVYDSVRSARLDLQITGLTGTAARCALFGGILEKVANTYTRTENTVIGFCN